ncbi:MAG: carbohydrate kinase family protein [Planctomycetota bacterium]
MASRAIAVAGHVCLDMIPTFPPHARVELAPGALIHVGPSVRSIGGAVGNTGLALHRLGQPVRLIGKLGDDGFGRGVLTLLDAIDPRLAEAMTVAAGATSSYTVVIDPPDVDRLFLHCPGANDTFTDADVDWDRLDDAAILHFGYPPVMRSMLDPEPAHRMFTEAHRRGLITSLDMTAIDPASDAAHVDWIAWLQRVLPTVDLFLPSLDETLTMLGEPPGPPTPKTLATVTDRLLDLGARVVMLKLGDRGASLRTASDPPERLTQLANDAWADRELYTPCFEAEVAGTTGSGDCTIAGFLTAVMRGAGPIDCLTAATAVGGASVETTDVTSALPAWSAIAQRVAAGWPRHAPTSGFEGWPELGQGVRRGPRDGG